MEKEGTVRGFLDEDAVAIAEHVKKNDEFKGKSRTGRIYVPSKQLASAAPAGSLGETLDEIPYLLDVESDDSVDGIPPELTSDSDQTPGPRGIFRSPLTAFPVVAESDDRLRLIPVAREGDGDHSLVHNESVRGRSYPQADPALLPDGSIAPFQPFELPPPVLPLSPPAVPSAASPVRPALNLHRRVRSIAGASAHAVPADRFIVMPPSRIPVPGTDGQFIVLGGVVDSQFTEIISQGDVKNRIERYGAIVINAYQTEPRSDETPLHEKLRDDVTGLQLMHQMAGFADVDYHQADLRDTVDAPINEHIFTTVLLMDAALAAGKQVFVYCGKGVSRSATFVEGLLILVNNMTSDDASAYVLERRGVVYPNPTFSFALRNLARYNHKIIGTTEEALSKISLAEKIAAIKAIIRAEQERTMTDDEPASPISPGAIAVPPVVQQPSSYGACCAGGHSFREIIDILPGTNPHSSMGSAPRSWSHRAAGSNPGFDPVIDDRRPEDDKPDHCFAHSVRRTLWLHEPATVGEQTPGGPLPPLPGSTAVEDEKRKTSVSLGV